MTDDGNCSSEKEHLERLQLQEAQQHMIRMLTEDYGESLEETYAISMLHKKRVLPVRGLSTVGKAARRCGRYCRAISDRRLWFSIGGYWRSWTPPLPPY